MKLSKEAKILLIGGHMTPALAVADKLKEKDYKNLLWVGHKYSQTGDKSLSAEFGQVYRRHIRFIHLPAGKLWRKWTLNTLFKGIWNLLLIPYGFLFGSAILLLEKPAVIIGFGGYLSVPIILQLPLIKFLKIQVYIHEQTVAPGRATRFTSKFAQKIFLTWDESKKFYPKEKALVTGNPIQKEFMKLSTKSSLFENDLPTLLVIGGNQGANTFNKRLMPPTLKSYLEKMNIIHSTGSSSLTQDYSKAISAREHLPKKYQERYKIYPYIPAKELNIIYSNASFALSRSGVNATLEILMKGLPTIFIPLPWSSGNEQMTNAKIAAETGLARILEFREGMTSEELFNEITKALEQIHHTRSFKDWSWKEAKDRAKGLVKLDAARRIVDFVINSK